MSKQFILSIVSLLMITFSVLSCTNDSAATSAETATDQVATTTESATAKTNATATERPFLIEENGIEGINFSKPVARITNHTKPGKMKNAEGIFPIYRFTSKGANEVKLGYFAVDTKSGERVGDLIVITSPKAATSFGIGVGSTFAELQAAVPDIVVHGSEIESRTTAFVGNIGFLLDVPFNTYEVDESKIASDTKVKEVMIMAKAPQ